MTHQRVLRIAQHYELDTYAYAGSTGDFVVIGSADSCDALGRLSSRMEELRQALEESIRLQSHYAELLNTYDGGERRGFVDGQAWIDRLKALGTIG